MAEVVGVAQESEGAKMTRKDSDKPKKAALTDQERHRRFVEMAKEVEASEKPADFEKAFKKVTSPTR